MKKMILLLTLFCLGLTSMAQEGLIRKGIDYSIKPEFGLDVGVPYFYGDNLLSNDYLLNPTIRLNFQAGITDRLGFGLFISRNGGQVGETEILGDFFDRVNWQSQGGWLFYAIPLSDKFVIEPGLGVAVKTMTHFDGENKFRLNYHSFFQRTRFKYQLHQLENRNALHLILSGDLNMVRGPRIRINEDDRRYVQQGLYSNFCLGLAFSFF